MIIGCSTSTLSTYTRGSSSQQERSPFLQALHSILHTPLLSTRQNWLSAPKLLLHQPCMQLLCNMHCSRMRQIVIWQTVHVFTFSRRQFSIHCLASSTFLPATSSASAVWSLNLLLASPTASFTVSAVSSGFSTTSVTVSCGFDNIAFHQYLGQQRCAIHRLIAKNLKAPGLCLQPAECLAQHP